MKRFVFICFLLAFQPVFAEKDFFYGENRFLLAQNDTYKTFDPFIDYGEFQDNVTEEESIIFFQTGRSLTISLLGGYEAISLNMRQIYGDAPFIFGLTVGFFLDLRFAFQVNGFLPYGHYDSLLNTSSKFYHYGVDLKYYFNRQYNNKNADFFNPYLIFGPFWVNIKSNFAKIQPRQLGNTNQGVNPIITNEEAQAAGSHSAFGGKIGLGFELPFIKQSFIGFEASYLYTNLQHEAEDLSTLTLPPPNYNPNQSLIERLQFPNRPELSGWRFFGDLVNIVFLLGVNF